ncbi:NAD-dependent epimerase/dehydratase family protein [Mitsuokella sp.]|uniref:NAD-dependent epimerase/dehydratase family protein n=1 Tax=Mitsuokella sp. TaxID=2049034 RepID=UPI003D7CEA5C
MKILVTGGAGFIGSHLVRQLIELGHEVVVLDNLSTGAREHLPAGGFAFWQMDDREAAAREKIAAGHFDAIVHLAGQTMVDASIRDPHFDAAENVMGTVNVLEAARESGVSRVIFASTAAAYGDVTEDLLPLREELRLAPLSFYGLTKVTVEHYLDLYHELYGLDYVVLRFANVYGERQGDRGEGGVISIFAKRVARGEGLTIFGDGGQTRDFIYAGDVAHGICRALVTEKVNTAYNLSTQTETSLKELVSIFGKVEGKELTPAYKEAREGDIYRSMLANEKAKDGLGWEPEVSLTEGLRRTVAYFRSAES